MTMKEGSPLPDISYQEALTKAAIFEAERILESPEQYRSFMITVDTRGVEFLQRGLFEVYENVLNPQFGEQDQLSAHPENGIKELNEKLINSLALSDKGDKHAVALNAREIDILGDAVMQTQSWDMHDRETIHPWDDERYAAQAQTVMSMIRQFEGFGGQLLSQQAKEHFSSRLGEPEIRPQAEPKVIYLYKRQC